MKAVIPLSLGRAENGMQGSGYPVLGSLNSSRPVLQSDDRYMPEPWVGVAWMGTSRPQEL